MITTRNKIENFIENEDEWFSGIELKVLDLEKELTEWRESRTREFTEAYGSPGKPRKPSGRAQVLIERGRRPARRPRSGRGRTIAIGVAAANGNRPSNSW